MKITADEKCYLTEVANVSLDKRSFRKMIIVSGTEEASQWRQITEEKKASLDAQKAIFDNQDITPDYLDKVSILISGIKEKINGTDMSAEEALAHKQLFPTFEEIIGKDINVGYRFTSGDDMYESLQAHKVSADLKPYSASVGPELLAMSTSYEGTDKTYEYYKLVK